MITFQPLWETMKAKKISTYALITRYNVSKGTLDSLKHDRNVTTATLNELCRILNCDLDEVAAYIPDKN